MLSSVSWSGLSASAWWSPSGLDQSPPPPPSVTYRAYDGGEEVVVFGRRGGSEPGFGAYGGLTGPAENSARNARWAAMSPQERVMAMGLDPFASIGTDARFEEATYSAASWDLNTHEGGTFRGHVIEKHVGKDRTYLESRIQKEGLEFASTFFTLDEAQAAIGEALNSDFFAAASRSALARGINRLTWEWFPMDDGRFVGAVLDRNGDFSPGQGVRIVLRADPSRPEGWSIVTAHPITQPRNP